MSALMVAITVLLVIVGSFAWAGLLIWGARPRRERPWIYLAVSGLMLLRALLALLEDSTPRKWWDIAFALAGVAIFFGHYQLARRRVASLAPPSS